VALMKRVLMVEDDPVIARTLQLGLALVLPRA
jgi:hypothetical protein